MYIYMLHFFNIYFVLSVIIKFKSEVILKNRKQHFNWSYATSKPAMSSQRFAARDSTRTINYKLYPSGVRVCFWRNC